MLADSYQELWMSFTVRYDPENKCLIGCFVGTFDKGTRDEYARAILQAGQEHNCKCFLNDMSNIKLDLTTMDIFHLPRFLDSIGIDRSWQRAVVFSRDYDQFRFLETRMINEGHQVRIFQDHDAAIEWLKEE